MMSGESGTEKSQYWNRVLTVDMSDIVFLHCHQSGKGSFVRVIFLLSGHVSFYTCCILIFFYVSHLLPFDGASFTELKSIVL